jgi:PQQ-dependent catabolism-associated CXXCW motif protein
VPDRLRAFAFHAWPPARTAEECAEPDGYRTDNYRAPFPRRLPARAFSRPRGRSDLARRAGVFIDVLPRAPKPPNLPAGTVWRDKPRLNIPGSVWLPDTGYGKLAAATEDYLRRGLERASGGNKPRCS